MTHAVDASGRVLRDNVWGPQEQDAVRRDFTINAMYYDPETQIVVDYHGGIADSAKRVMRMIGDPAQRYREDPVRIIRAIRFSAKLKALGFKLEPRTAAPLVKMKSLLADVPQSRLFDEMLKLLQTGHAMASIAKLQELGLDKGIYPLLDLVVERAESPFVKAALLDTDRRVGEGKPVAPSFLLACVLWADVREGWSRRTESAERQPSFPALQDAIDQVFSERIGDVSGGGRLASDMREIWMMQPRFEKRVGQSAFGLVDQPRFRAGFDFMRLRADVGEIDDLLADWWQEFSMASDSLRTDMLEQQRSEQGRRSRAPRAPKQVDDAQAPLRHASQSAAAEDQGERGGSTEVGESGAGAAPRKRRRRRKPTGDRSGGNTGAAPTGGAET